MERRISIVGAGDMGHGFAVHFARHGRDVTLVDHRESNLDAARDRIRETAAFLNEAELADRSPAAFVDAVEFTTDREAGVADAEFVLETVPEDLDLKREVFAALGDEAPDDAVLASNTSGLPVTEIAAGAPEHAERIVGCHWWYPPYLLDPVEVVRGAETADETVERTAALLTDVDRRPIRVERDVPGFVWNRVQMAVVRECTHLVAAGVASAEDVNAAIRDGYARRTAVIGPLETIDVAGLDLFRTVASDLFPHLSDADEPNALFDDLLDDGRGGIEDGAGFFEYDAPPAEITRSRDEGLAAIDHALAKRDRERDG